jgi:hypothetical protein
MQSRNVTTKTDRLSQLSTIQLEVTQNDATGRGFENEFWDHKDAGIYVELVSDEPLFASIHKYDSRSCCQVSFRRWRRIGDVGRFSGIWRLGTTNPCSRHPANRRQRHQDRPSQSRYLNKRPHLVGAHRAGTANHISGQNRNTSEFQTNSPS